MNSNFLKFMSLLSGLLSIFFSTILISMIIKLYANGYHYSNQQYLTMFILIISCTSIGFVLNRKDIKENGKNQFNRIVYLFNLIGINPVILFFLIVLLLLLLTPFAIFF